MLVLINRCLKFPLFDFAIYFQCKLVNIMGISVTRPDGLLEPLNRAGSLSLLDRELERLRFKLQFEEGGQLKYIICILN